MAPENRLRADEQAERHCSGATRGRELGPAELAPHPAELFAEQAEARFRQREPESSAASLRCDSTIRRYILAFLLSGSTRRASSHFATAASVLPSESRTTPSRTCATA